MAEEVREILASLGLRSLDEAIGRVDLLGAQDAIEHWKARGVDLTHVLAHIELPEGSPRHRIESPPAVLEDALDWELVERSQAVIEAGSAAGSPDGASGNGAIETGPPVARTSNARRDRAADP